MHGVTIPMIGIVLGADAAAEPLASFLEGVWEEMGATLTAKADSGFMEETMTCMTPKADMNKPGTATPSPTETTIVGDC